MSLTPTSLVLPACALVAVGLFVAALRTPGLKPNHHTKRARSGSMKRNRNKGKRSMAARGILIVPKEGLR